MKESWIAYLSQLNLKPNPERGLYLSLGYPLLLHWVFIFVAGGLLLSAALQRWVPLLVITVFMLSAALVAKVWSRAVLRGLTLKLTPDRDRAFAGETLDLNFELTNAKSIFVPWLEVSAELPYRLQCGIPQTVPLYARQRLSWSTAVSGGNRIRWRYGLECRHRGDYRLGPLRLRFGDLFGLFPGEIVIPSFHQVLVYPEIVPLKGLGLPLSELTGSTTPPQNLYEDTSRTAGTRDYQYGDPLKRIHWKGSARHRELQVRQLESTTSINLLMILDVASFNQPGADMAAVFEVAVTAAASCAYEAQRHQLPVGMLAGASPEIRLPVGSGRATLMTILEALARVSAQAETPLDVYLTQRHTDLTLGSTLLVLSHHITPSLLSTARKFHDEGFKLVLALFNQIQAPTETGPIKILTVNSQTDIGSRLAAVTK